MRLLDLDRRVYGDIAPGDAQRNYCVVLVYGVEKFFAPPKCCEVPFMSIFKLD